jgi:hypothetical protein
MGDASGEFHPGHGIRLWGDDVLDLARAMGGEVGPATWPDSCFE